MRQGAVIASSTFGTGKGETVVINASESVDLAGTRTDPFNGFVRTSIRADGYITTGGTLLASLGITTRPSGDSGSVIINTSQIRVADGAQITVGNDGSGKAGNLGINAERLTLENDGRIVANTASGEGGDITLNLQELLSLRHGSLISAEAKGSGNGGNITIKAPVIVGFENSDIVANAFQGKGGNIQITTQGIFGLKFRSQLTPENDITASSQFGVNGTVAINNLNVDPASGLVQLPVTLADASRKMGSLCQQMEGSSFVYTGRGGLPENPLERFEGLHPWEDLRDLSAFQHQPPVAPPPRQAAEPAFIVEANAIHRHPDGTVELVAEGAGAVLMNDAMTCAGKVWFGESNP